MVQAIAEASEGTRPTRISDTECLRYFGCSLDAMPDAPRRLVAVQAGGRGGKTSRLLAPKALHAAWTVPLPTLAQGEHAVSLIVSSELAFALQALSFCKGYVEGSPRMRDAIVGEIKTESFTLRRPDGKLVDVRVRAAGARGTGGRAFTLVFGGLDEAAFFRDASGVVNDQEIHRAITQRVVPGGQEWMLSTPWVAGVGLLEAKIAESWGHHDRALAVREVGTRALNPTWDPTGEIEADLRESDPDNAAREIDAKPLTAGSQHFFSHEAIDAAQREDAPQQLRYEPSSRYGAGGDTGFTRNSSALAIIERTEEGRYRLARLEERKPLPGLPLKPEAVALEFADVMLEYNKRDFATDSHERVKVHEAMQARGCAAVPAPEKREAMVALRAVLHDGLLEIPKHPRLRQQLRDVMVKPMPGGGTQITSPKRADGSHGDLVSALANAVAQAMREAPDPPAPPPPPAFEERGADFFASRE